MGLPALAAIQAGAGILQSVIGGIKAAKAQKQLEKLQTPTYAQSKSVLDYYNNALSRYNVNPYQTNLYRMQKQNIDRSTTGAIGALNSRRGVLGGLSGIIQGQNDAMLKAASGAEMDSNQKFAQLGGAAQMKAGEDRMAFQYNQVAPYEKKYNLLAMKASGGNQIMNAGLSNIFGGLSSMRDMALAKEMYGTGSNAGSGATSQQGQQWSGYYNPRTKKWVE